MTLAIHIKEQPVAFRRFGAIWTPTALVLDSDANERWRIEGYLPRPEFHAQLQMALARVALMAKKWPDAEAAYDRVLTGHPATFVVPEALYWRGISRYRQTNDHKVLEELAEELQAHHATSIWAVKASVWGKKD